MDEPHEEVTKSEEGLIENLPTESDTFFMSFSGGKEFFQNRCMWQSELLVTIIFGILHLTEVIVFTTWVIILILWIIGAAQLSDFFVPGLSIQTGLLLILIAIWIMEKVFFYVFLVPSLMNLSRLTKEVLDIQKEQNEEIKSQTFLTYTTSFSFSLISKYFLNEIMLFAGFLVIGFNSFIAFFLIFNVSGIFFYFPFLICCYCFLLGSRIFSICHLAADQSYTFGGIAFSIRNITKVAIFGSGFLIQSMVPFFEIIQHHINTIAATLYLSKIEITREIEIKTGEDDEEVILGEFELGMPIIPNMKDTLEKKDETDGFGFTVVEKLDEEMNSEAEIIDGTMGSIKSTTEKKTAIIDTPKKIETIRIV